jgi:Do/DeqQ family serine protease
MKRFCLAAAGLLLISACSSDKGRKRPEPNETKPKAKPALRLSDVLARPAFAYAQGKQGRQVSLSDIAERAVRSVVNISSTRTVRQPRAHSPYRGNPFFDYFRHHGAPQRERRAKSLGSGVIVSADGLVVTNNHVVKNASSIRVTLSDGRTLSAKALGTDPKSDLALLRLEGELKKIQPIPFGASGKLRLGEVVLAIGNPFGVGQTVTMGIVSALGRANMGIVDYEDFIQTDAAINPGNSGGALIDMRGKLVGINTAILSRSGGYQGIGFAIPAAMVKPIMESLLKHGRVVRGWLGVAIQDLTKEMAVAMGLSVEQGVLVADVQPESPAQKAGLRRGDVIIKLDGAPTLSVSRLRNKVASSGAKAKIKLTVLREGKEQGLEVTLGVLPGDRSATLDATQGVLGGLSLEPMTEEQRQRRRLPARVGGVLVKSVEPRSAADSAGLRGGDVILQINRQPAASPYAFSQIYRKARDRVLLLVHRGGSTMYLLLAK